MASGFEIGYDSIELELMLRKIAAQENCDEMVGMLFELQKIEGNVLERKCLLNGTEYKRIKKVGCGKIEYLQHIVKTIIKYNRSLVEDYAGRCLLVIKYKNTEGKMEMVEIK
jgi:hypothetical protein